MYDRLINFIDLQPHDYILDVGSGRDQIWDTVREVIGPEGKVILLDISQPDLYAALSMSGRDSRFSAVFGSVFVSRYLVNPKKPLILHGDVGINFGEPLRNCETPHGEIRYSEQVWNAMISYWYGSSMKRAFNPSMWKEKLFPS